MAARAVTVVAKTLLSEEAEKVVKTAARMIRTTVADESGTVCVTDSVGVNLESVSVESGTETVENALGRRGFLDASQPKAPEYDISNAPREIDLPGSKSAPEIQPNRSSLLESKTQSKSPNEVEFPDSNSNPNIKPGEIDVAEEVGKGVPTDPEALVFTVEQGRKHRGPEVGETRAAVEVDDRRKKIQESTESGETTADTGRPDNGPEVGVNPRDGLIN